MSGKLNKSYHTVTPYLIVSDVPRLLRFLAEAFGATERLRLPRPDGSIRHAEVTIGDSIVMMGEPTDKFGPMPASIFLRVANADASYQGNSSGRYFGYRAHGSIPCRRTLWRR